MALLSNLNVFSTKPNFFNILNKTYETILPEAGWSTSSTDGQINFEIGASGQLFTDLNIYVKIRSKIQNNSYDTADKQKKFMDCAPLSDIMSIFKQVLVKLNTVCLAGNQGNNIYKVTLPIIYVNFFIIIKVAIDGRFGRSAHEKIYNDPQTTLYVEDNPIQFDMGLLDNDGFKTRAECYQNGQSYITLCPLNLDIARSSRLLIPGCSLQVVSSHYIVRSAKCNVDPGAPRRQR